MKIENSRTADVQSETAYLTHHFAVSCFVPIILSAPRNKLGDDVSVQFIRHVPQKITRGDEGLIGTPSVNHTVRIIVKDLFLEGIMARGEGCHKDVGLGAFDGIVLDTGVNGFQDVIGTEAESADIESGIGDESEQWAGLWTVTVVGLLIRSLNLPQKLLSINLAVALRPGFLAMLAMSSRMPSHSW